MLAQQRTSIRERRSLRLDDGSQLALNADTALDIRFDSKQRLIQVYRGEMLVNTTQDSTQRPFIVQTGEGRVRALGTRFSVRQLTEQTRAGVLQAAVEVNPHQHVERTLRLSAGEQDTFDRDAVDVASPLPLYRACWASMTGGWTLSSKSCDAIALAYCATSVQGLSISGTFRLHDTDTVPENLSQALPVRVHYLTRYWASIESA